MLHCPFRDDLVARVAGLSWTVFSGLLVYSGSVIRIYVSQAIGSIEKIGFVFDNILFYQKD
jgi:hypothetical protein